MKLEESGNNISGCDSCLGIIISYAVLKALFTGSVRPVFFLCGLSKVPASISGSPVAILHTYSHYSINCVVCTYGKCGANYIFSSHSFSTLKSHSVYIKLAIIPVLVAHRLEI